MAKSATIEIPHQLLRTLHRIHEQRSDLQGRIDRVPRQRLAAQALVTTATEAVAAAKDELRKTKMISGEKQLQLNAREAHVQELQAKLNTAGSNKEFSLLKDQIAADEQANSVQSDEIFETLEQIDALTESLAATEADLVKHQAECDERLATIDVNLADLTEQMERVQAELATSEAQIPSAARSDYDRLTASRGEEALAPLDGDSCGGCYQTLTTQTISQLQLSKLTHCPNCNSFLYLAEDLRVR